MNLELLALRWLLYEKRCEIAICERSPRSLWCGQPDVLGITKARYTIEIEIKRSLSDFRADSDKPSRKYRHSENPNLDKLLSKLPKQFYYLVPAELQARVELILPAWAGLMIPPRPGNSEWLHMCKVAPVNRESKRLAVKECCRLVRMVANWAMSEAESRQAQFLRFRDGYWPWPEPDFEI